MKPESRKPIVALLEQAIQKRAALSGYTNAFRLVNSLGDGIPGICVDRYNHHFVVHKFPAADETTLNETINTITKLYNPEYLIVKHRQISGGKEYDNARDRVVLQKGDSKTIVTEYGLQFEVDLNDTMNTGLFLDMRANRHTVAEYAAGKDVLNCFSYTCSFGVHCRAMGANRVVNVDIAAKILDRGRRNYELNGLEVHEFEFAKADSLRYLKGAVKRGNLFDIIILDPPTFARHQGEIFSVEKELPGMLSQSFSILKPGGIILAATNCSGIPYEALLGQIGVSATQSGRTILESTRLEQDSDYPGSGSMRESYLSCCLARAN